MDEWNEKNLVSDSKSNRRDTVIQLVEPVISHSIESFEVMSKFN